MIELSDYTWGRRRFLKRKGYCAVYVAGPAKGYPSKIGIAEDVYDRILALDAGSYAGLRLHYALWTPGKSVARTIERRAHEILKTAGKWRKREWFDVPAEWAERTIETAAHECQPGGHFKRHPDVMRGHEDKITVDPEWAAYFQRAPG